MRLQERSERKICRKLPMKNRYFFITLLIFLLDHATKWLAFEKLNASSPIEIIPGYLRLSYAQNTGVAFGFFDKVESEWKPYILAALAIAAVMILLIYSSRTPPSRKLLHCALAITLGGILGNFADRFLRGYVVDFIEFHIHEAFYWPNFNVADSAITVGVALLLLDTVKNPAVEETAGQSPADEQS